MSWRLQVRGCPSFGGARGSDDSAEARKVRLKERPSYHCELRRLRAGNLKPSFTLSLNLGADLGEPIKAVSLLLDRYMFGKFDRERRTLH